MRRLIRAYKQFVSHPAILDTLTRSIKALTALSLGWENGFVRGLTIVTFKPLLLYFRQTVLTCFLWRLHCLPMSQMSQSRFYRLPSKTALWRHSNKNNAAINNRFLDFVQASGLMWLLVTITWTATSRISWNLYNMDRLEIIDPKNGQYLDKYGKKLECPNI